MNLKKPVFTTFEAAKICAANITSIKNWIEQGELKAFRTPGGHFRIERAELVQFLDKHNMPNPFSDKVRLLAMHTDHTFLNRFPSKVLTSCHIDHVTNPVDGLISLGQQKPNVVVLDASFSNIDVRHMCSRIKQHPEFLGTQIIVCEVDPEDAFDAHQIVEKGDHKGLLDALLVAVFP
jgi:excisionase family DNA binding protein